MSYAVDVNTVSTTGPESSPVAAALVMYAVDDPRKRAVGFKLSEGMEVPAELATRFKFATQ